MFWIKEVSFLRDLLESYSTLCSSLKCQRLFKHNHFHFGHGGVVMLIEDTSTIISRVNAAGGGGQCLTNDAVQGAEWTKYLIR